MDEIFDLIESDSEEFPTYFCKYLIEGGHLNLKNGKTFTVNINMSCDVNNEVYVVRCQGCDKDYVGETGNLRQKVTFIIKRNVIQRLGKSH